MQPVRTRARFGALALVALVGLVWPACVLAHHVYRPDLGALPLGWVIAAAALCGRGVLSSLTRRAGPPARRRAPGAGARLARPAAARWRAAPLRPRGQLQVPGVSLRPEDAHLTLAAVLRPLRQLRPRDRRPRFSSSASSRSAAWCRWDARALGMALGAAGGAMGGFVLHFICPFAGTAHVVLGHVGGTILAAAAGAALLPALLRR